MTRQDPQLKLRLPEALKEKIEVLAKVNGRSMNAEIVARLEKSLSDDGGTTLSELAAAPGIIDSLAAALAERFKNQSDFVLVQTDWPNSDALKPESMIVVEAKTSEKPARARILRTAKPKDKPSDG